MLLEVQPSSINFTGTYKQVKGTDHSNNVHLLNLLNKDAIEIKRNLAPLNLF